MTHPLTEFAHSRRRAPYVSSGVLVSPVTLKAGLAVARVGALVHHVGAAASVLNGDRIQYGAQWLCNSGANDVILLADVSAHSGQACVRCADKAAGSFIYRCFGEADLLLYIGSTAGYAARMKRHAAKSAWWPDVARITKEGYGSISEARAAERRAIRAEVPQHNSHRYAAEAVAS
jgi:hypothetical protein